MHCFLCPLRGSRCYKTLISLWLNIAKPGWFGTLGLNGSEEDIFKLAAIGGCIQRQWLLDQECGDESAG